jgi:3-polyprenyl-4-hydroxybenzoate decarboxylase
MTQLAEMGAVIAPPMPAFYARPVDLAEMIDHTIGRVLDLFDIDSRTVRRWTRHGHSSLGSRGLMLLFAKRRFESVIS